ncbi:MAG: DUF1631 domain-containing protein [Marinicella sp.]
MKEKKSQNNVLKISPELKERINQGRILPHVHKLFLKGLKPAIQDYYNNLDDSLFDIAEKADSNELQTEYFAAMREVRKKKELMVRKFSENIQNAFKQFKKGDYDYFIKPQPKDSDDSFSHLALVDEHELNQKLAVTNMIEKSNTYLHQQLFAFQKRFTLLAGGSELEYAQIPASPSVIIQSFANTFSHLEITPNVELIMLKLFERNLLPNLNLTYDDINNYLREEGVYPSLKYKVASRRSTTNSMTPSPLSENEAKQSVPEQVLPHYEDENFQVIANALNKRHSGSPNPHHNWPIFEAALISNMLNVLQNQELQNLNTRQDSMTPTEIKDQLLSQLRSKAEQEQKQVNKQDEDIIDLVGMLFQFLVDDRNLPHRIQAVLAKLQIPYLHFALKDRKLFTNKNNQARKLLDTLAQASVGWTKEGDNKGNFINKVEQVVQQVLETSYENLDFAALVEDFEQFHQKHTKRVNIIEKRTSEKALGQERIQKAKENTAEILQTKMKNYSLPKTVTDILLTPWANVLTLAYLRHADEPEKIDEYVNFINKLIYVSVKNKKNQATKAQISHVIHQLSNGLRLVAFDEHSIKQQSKELYQQLLSINGIDPNSSAEDHEFILPQEAFKVDESSDEDKPEIVHFIADKKINRLEPEVEHIEDVFYQEATKMTPGDWIEYVADKEEDVIRAKLSWISPISQKLLFVNARGVKVTDKSLDELAYDLRHKIAVILQQIPIFDRAMTAIAKQVTEETKKNETTKATSSS